MALPASSPAFGRLARLALRGRPALLLAVALLTALALGQARARLRVETSPEHFAAGDAAQEARLAALRQDFGRDDPHLLLVEGEVFTPAFVERLRALHDALEALPLPGAEAVHDDEGWGGPPLALDEVQSLANARRLAVDGEALRTRPLLEGDPEGVRARALADPGLVGRLLGADGRHALIIARGRPMDQEAVRATQRDIEALARAHSAPGFEVTATGMPALELALSSGLMRDMRALAGVVLGLMAAALWALFRHPLGVLGPLAVALVSVAWTLGFMAAADMPVTLVSNIVPAFILCVGLGDAVHVQSAWRDAREGGASAEEAVVQALSATGPPVVLTTLTTVAGLLSFRLASTRGVQELGLAAAFGVSAAMALSLTLLPLTLSLLRRGRLRPRGAVGGVDRLLGLASAASAGPGGPRRVALATLPLLGLVALGLSRVEVHHDPLDWLPVDDPTRQSIERVEAHIGGTSSFEVLVDAEGPLGVRDRELLLGLQALDVHLRSWIHPADGRPAVTGSLSLLDVVRDTRAALHGEAPPAEGLPATQREVSDALLLFESASPRELRRLATADLARARLSVRTRWMDATSMQPLTRHVEQGIAAHLGPWRAFATGSVFALVSVVAALIEDLLRSFGAAIGVIGLMMAAMLRSPRLALIGLLPNVLAVGVILAGMGLTGVPIDLATLLIASIVLGVAVDDAIHLLHQVQEARRGGAGREQALEAALGSCGRALVSTSLILALGFSAYLASSLVNVQRFGVLVASACLVALAANLVLLPALLRGPLGDPE